MVDDHVYDGPGVDDLMYGKPRQHVHCKTMKSRFFTALPAPHPLANRLATVTRNHAASGTIKP